MITGLERPKRQKPPLGATVDASHPLAKGLVGLWAFNEGNGRATRNLALQAKDGTNGVLTSGPVWQPGRGGAALRLAGGSTQFVACGGTSDYLAMPGSMSCAVLFRPESVAVGAQALIDHSATGSAGDYLLDVNRTAGRMSTVWGNAVIATGSVQISAGKDHMAMMTRGGVSGSWRCTLYTDGAIDVTATTTTNPNATVGSSETLIGAHRNSTVPAYTLPYTGLIEAAFLWNRELSPGEAVAWADRPYDVLLAPSTRRFFLPPPEPAPGTATGVVVGSPIVGSPMVVGSPVVGGIVRAGR